MIRYICLALGLFATAAQSDAGNHALTQSGKSHLAVDKAAKVASFPARILKGENPGDLFGWSIASAGDVNGDGYTDLIVGAPKNSAAAEFAGRAYVYFGGPKMLGGPNVVLTGEGTWDQFGSCVAGAGDVNRDGYDDVIVGVPTNDAGGTDAGRAYIFFGGPTMDSIPDVIITGSTTGDYLGYAVSCARDVNGDGYGDVIVGAPGNDAAGNQAGAAYIYFGGAKMDSIADITLAHPPGSYLFGSSVADVGDVNGDGYDDLLAGGGSGYIYFGGPDLGRVVDVSLEPTYVWAGVALFAGAGDVNHDGYADVIGGAPPVKYTNPVGRAYIYSGGRDMDGSVSISFAAESIDDHIGRSVAGGVDLDGNGFSDLIIGTPFHEVGGVQVGGAYVYFGGLELDTTLYVTLNHVGKDDQFGWSIAAARDFDGDGYGDVVVGAPAAGAGSVYIYLSTYRDAPRTYYLGVSDSVGNRAALEFGFAPSATSGIDSVLGELELPPFPPSGVFDARFVGQDIGIDLGEGSLVDFRQGDSAISTEYVHEIAYQTGGGSITLVWGLPQWIEGRLQDIITGTIIDTVMRGKGSYTVTNPGAISKLKMTIHYGVNPVWVAEHPALPERFILEQNYPNPFNPRTVIRYTIEGNRDQGSGLRKTTLAVYDVLGRQVSVLVNERKPSGNYEVTFDGSALPSGVYFYRMMSGDFTATRRMILIK